MFLFYSIFICDILNFFPIAFTFSPYFAAYGANLFIFRRLFSLVQGK